MLNFDDFVHKLENVRIAPDASIIARCPACGGDDALSARRGRRVQIVAFCRERCRFEDVIRGAEFAAARRAVLGDGVR
jgi:hypothetical protein